MSDRVWTSLELVNWTADYFRRHGVPSPRLDAELLLAHVLGVRRLDLYLRFERPVPAEPRQRYRELVRARACERVPVAYLTGEREFWSLPLKVNRDVLIPRPETELLVRVSVELAPRRLAEVGVGSGAVLAALASELPEAELVGVDCSEAALVVARENLLRLGLTERVELLCGEGTSPLRPGLEALISNPPYIPTDELARLEPEIAHEPKVALDGGPDGLSFIRKLIAAAPSLLIPEGWLALEIGRDQSAGVQRLLGDHGAKEVTAHRDLQGHERVLVARFAGALGSA